MKESCSSGANSLVSAPCRGAPSPQPLWHLQGSDNSRQALSYSRGRSLTGGLGGTFPSAWATSLPKIAQNFYFIIKKQTKALKELSVGRIPEQICAPVLGQASSKVLGSSKILGFLRVKYEQ